MLPLIVAQSVRRNSWSRVTASECSKIIAFKKWPWRLSPHTHTKIKSDFKGAFGIRGKDRIGKLLGEPMLFSSALSRVGRLSGLQEPNGRWLAAHTHTIVTASREQIQRAKMIFSVSVTSACCQGKPGRLFARRKTAPERNNHVSCHFKLDPVADDLTDCLKVLFIAIFISEGLLTLRCLNRK